MPESEFPSPRKRPHRQVININHQLAVNSCLSGSVDGVYSERRTAGRELYLKNNLGKALSGGSSDLNDSSQRFQSYNLQFHMVSSKIASFAPPNRLDSMFISRVSAFEGN